MKDQIILCIVSSILFLGCEAYELYYERLEYEFHLKVKRKYRRLIRNVIGVLLIALDVVILIQTRHISDQPLKLSILFFTVCPLILLHFVASLFALGYSTKGYRAIDIISHIIRLICAFAEFVIAFFVEDGGKGLVPSWMLPAACAVILCTRSTRMLNGEWMEIHIEDIMSVEDSYIAQAEMEYEQWVNGKNQEEEQ